MIHKTTSTTPPPLIIGEVLFDHFPDGTSVPGGAPFNVAWNLQGLGLSPVFVSSVGEDDQGAQILDLMRQWGMETTGVHVDSLHPTGKVEVVMDGGGHSFRIVENCAYDHIHYPARLLGTREFSLVYMGSLACRSETTRNAVLRLADETDIPRFVDINIREPWFDLSLLPTLLSGAAWVKLNNDELTQVTGIDCTDAGNIEQALGKMRHIYGNAHYFITCGSDGAYACDLDDNLTHEQSPSPDCFRDTVGAGDAFSSASIFGLLHGWKTERILRAAVRFAARTCCIQGATTADKEHFARLE